MPREIEYLMRRYRLDEEAAMELLAELRDTRSLRRLVGPSRVAGGASLPAQQSYTGDWVRENPPLVGR